MTATTNNWIFTPTTKDAIEVYVANTDYLAYGIWLKRTTKDGETTYDEVEALYRQRRRSNREYREC